MNKPAKYRFRKVAFLEQAFHNEVLEAYVFHFLPISENIVIFTNSFNFQQTGNLKKISNIDWHIRKADESLSDFLTAQNEILELCDVILVTSLPDGESDFGNFTFPIPAWLLIHNIHSNFAPPLRQLFLGKEWFRDVFKIIRHYGTKKIKKSKKIHQNFENIIFPTETMATYYKNNCAHESFPEPLVIPFIRSIRNIVKTQSEVFKIVVPGNITMYSRDYSLLLQAIQIVLKRTTKRIELTLLGKKKDTSCRYILKEFKKLESDRFTFRYFTSFVEQEKFDTEMSTAHILVSPLQKITRYGIHRELFGYSTESGNIADIVKYNLPGILPYFYPLHPAIEPLVKRYYSAQSLSEKILEWMVKYENSSDQPENIDIGFFSSEQVSQRILIQLEKVHPKNATFADD